MVVVLRRGHGLRTSYMAGLVFKGSHGKMEVATTTISTMMINMNAMITVTPKLETLNSES